MAERVAISRSLSSPLSPEWMDVLFVAMFSFSKDRVQSPTAHTADVLSCWVSYILTRVSSVPANRSCNARISGVFVAFAVPASALIPYYKALHPASYRSLVQCIRVQFIDDKRTQFTIVFNILTTVHM